MAALVSEQENYIRMSLLLTGVSPRAVRRLFDREFAPACLTISMRKEYRKIKNLFFEKHINKEQWKLLQGPQLESISFDLPLMICLLRNLTNIAGPKTGYDVLPQPSDQCAGADLARLKYYRNFMAHVPDDKIDNSYFGAAWDDIYGAIQRLGDQSLMPECAKLKHGPLDNTSVEILKEVKHSNVKLAVALEDIDDLKDEIKELKKDNDDTAETMSKSINRLYSVRGGVCVMKRNMGNYNKYNSNVFVETKSYRKIINALENHQCVIVTGPPGCGKIFNTRMAARWLKNQDKYFYKLDSHITDMTELLGKAPIFSAYDLTKMITPVSYTTIHLLDGFLGKCSLNKRNFMFWKEQLHKLKQTLRTKQIKIVLTCRSHIYDTYIKGNLGIPFYHCSVLYSEEEIHNIYHSYVESNENVSLPTDPLLLALIPAICSLTNCHLFFKNIYSTSNVAGFIEYEMKRLKQDSIWGYKALVLLCLMNNRIDEKMFRKTSHSHDDVLRNICLESGERVSSIKDKIERNLSLLDGIFIEKANSTYAFKYEWLFDYMTTYIGNENIEIVIDCSDSALIRDNVLLQTTISPKDEHNENTSNSLCIEISADLKELYCKRLLKDLRNGYLWNVVSSCHERFAEFEMLLEWFKYHGENAIEVGDRLTGLHIASYFGLKDLVEVLIKVHKSQINAKDSSRRTPLYYACSMGYAEIAQLLVTNNPLADSVDKCWIDTNAFYIACTNQHLNVVKVLLKYLEIKNLYCVDSSLHILCENGNKDIAQLLIDHYVSVNCVVNSLMPLHIASFNGHTDIVNMLLTKNASVNADEISSTPLCMAAFNGHTKIVDILLQNYAAVNTSVTNALTPIYAASRNGHADIVEMLLNNKALVDTKYDDMTILGTACSELHENVIDVLLKHGADIENCKYKSSALHLVCRAPNLKDKTFIVQRLLGENVDINKFDSEGKTPLDYTLKNNDFMISKLLIQNGATVNHSTNSNNFPLLVAIMNGQKAIVEILLNTGVDVDSKDHNGNTILNALCSSLTSLRYHIDGQHILSDETNERKQKLIDFIELLLQFNADVYECNKDGYSPLTSACRDGKHYCIPLLLEHDLSLINRLDGNGKTPLYVACLNKQIMVVDYLLKYKANVNQQCSDGATALHAIILSRRITTCYESYENQNELLNRLLDADADVNLTDIENKSVLHLVCEMNDRTSAVILLKKQPMFAIKTLKGDTPLHSACHHGHTDMVALLLKHVTDVHKIENPNDENYNNKTIASNIKRYENTIINEPDNDGQTPLHVACIHENPKIAEILLRTGADINNLDSNNCTPLYLACQRSREVVVKLLLQSCANMNVACCKGWTPLHVSCSIGNERIVRLLLQNGADRSIEDKNGLTALEIASEHGYEYQIMN